MTDDKGNMKVSVFINMIARDQNGGTLIQAANGSMDGPPLVRFIIPTLEASDYQINQRLIVTIEKED